MDEQIFHNLRMYEQARKDRQHERFWDDDEPPLLNPKPKVNKSDLVDRGYLGKQIYLAQKVQKTLDFYKRYFDWKMKNPYTTIKDYFNYLRGLK